MLLVGSCRAAQDTLADQMSTIERLAHQAWWPTKPANPNDKYVGSAVCAECHKDIAAAQRESEMARTLLPVDHSKAADYVGKSITVDGFSYDFIEEDKTLAFRLRGATGSKPLTWAFGSGAISQVYMTAGDHSFNESHFSYFEPIHGFDVTPAQPNLRVPMRADGAGAASKSAEGRTVSMQEVRRCFSCHAANVPAEAPITGFIPGVTCETCHGPGANHAAAARAELPQSGALILNPARLRPVDRVDFCGACHATSTDVQLGGGVGRPTVRFPAYRLENSACWSNDARIQCTGCHDPHRPLSHDTAAYDQRCLSCHVTGANTKADADHPGRACPKSTQGCTGCHMPKYDFPDVHHRFTDHQIRIVKPGEPVPA